jgi:hypothetical protein
MLTVVAEAPGAEDDARLNTLAVLTLVPASAAAVPACEIDKVVYDE